jgi:hypothetical protein
MSIFLLVDQSWKQFVIHVQKKTKGLLLKNIVRTVKKSYAQNALNGIYGVLFTSIFCNVSVIYSCSSNVSESKDEFLTSFEAESKGKTDPQDL